MATASERSTAGVLRDAVDDGTRILQQEIQLAKQELTESLRAGVAALVGALVALFATVGFLVMAIVTLVTAISPHWAVALGVTVVFLALAGGAAAMALQRLRQISPMRQTVETMKENVQWARQQLTRDESSS